MLQKDVLISVSLSPHRNIVEILKSFQFIIHDQRYFIGTWVGQLLEHVIDFLCRKKIRSYHFFDYIFQGFS